MDFALDDDQQLIVETVRRFADRDLRGWAADADRAGAPPDRLAHVARRSRLLRRCRARRRTTACSRARTRTSTRALRGFELGRGCAALAALLETNVEPALAVGALGQRAAKQALFGSLAIGRARALAHDSRGALEIATTADRASPASSARCRRSRTASHVLVVAKARSLFLVADRRHEARRRSRRRAGARRSGRPRSSTAHASPPTSCSRGRDARSRGPRVGARVARGACGRRRDRGDGVRRARTRKSASSSASRSASSSR